MLSDFHWDDFAVVGIALIVGRLVNELHFLYSHWLHLQYGSAPPLQYQVLLNLQPFHLAVMMAGFFSLSSSYIKHLYHLHLTKHDFLKLLAVMTLAGGTIYRNTSEHKCAVRFYSSQPILHEVFRDLVKVVCGSSPRTIRVKGRNSMVTQVYNKGLVENLLSLSPTYNLRNCSLSGVQPTIRFLEESEASVVREAIRLVFSVNGSLRFFFEKTGNCYYLRPQLGAACLSPLSLLEEYCSIMRRYGIQVAPVLDRRYDYKGFLVTNSWVSLERFSQIGGFLDGVKVLRGRLRGMEKNFLLRTLLDLQSKGKTVFRNEKETQSFLEAFEYTNYVLQLDRIHRTF